MKVDDLFDEIAGAKSEPLDDDENGDYEVVVFDDKEESPVHGVSWDHREKRLIIEI